LFSSQNIYKRDYKSIEGIGILICAFGDAELNCVRTNILLMSEFKQFEIGISTSLYFPAIGTAGFDRVAVEGDNLDPQHLQE
jgi:hypothetical protein